MPIEIRCLRCIIVQLLDSDPIRDAQAVDQPLGRTREHRLPFGLKNRFDGSRPYGVAFLVGVQPIDAIQIAARPAVWAKNHARQIDEMQSWIRFGLGFDQPIGLADNGPVLPA